MRDGACFEVRAETGEDERADFGAHAWTAGTARRAAGSGGVGRRRGRELHPVFQRQALRDEVEFHQLKGPCGEEVGGDVEVSGVFGAETEGFRGEAMARDVGGEGCGEDGGFGGAVGEGLLFGRFVGVIGGFGDGRWVGVVWLLDEEGTEVGWGAEEIAESHFMWCGHCSFSSPLDLSLENVLVIC